MFLLHTYIRDVGSANREPKPGPTITLPQGRHYRVINNNLERYFTESIMDNQKVMLRINVRF